MSFFNKSKKDWNPYFHNSKFNSNTKKSKKSSVSILTYNSGTNIGPGKFYIRNGSILSTEAGTQVISSKKGIISNLYVALTTSPGDGNSRILTVRINGVDTAITITISGLNTSGSNTINTISVLPTDLISLQQTSTVNASNSIIIVSFQLS